MSDDETTQTHRRDPRGAPWPFGWALTLALTALVVVLAWKLYVSTPRPVHDASAQAHPVTPRGDLAADEKTTIEIFRQASPAVVQVTNLQRLRDVRGETEAEIPQGTGSGFVWDPAGYVVTNQHVVQDGNAFTVTFADHSVFEATPVGGDVTHDLAVLKIEPKGKPLPTLSAGSSADLVVGQKVFAIGNPFGLDQTLTTGIISGLAREIRSVAGTPILGVIQTDAAINPGNSGGPLLDSSGRLIGMNTQIASPSGASAGVGFAIPVDTINRIVPQLIRTGKYLRPGLGILVFPDSLAVRMGLRGVVIQELLSDSAAGRAGMRPSQISGGRLVATGDAIVGIDGQRIDSRADLFRVLDGREVGHEVNVTYLREGKEHTAKVRLVGVE